MPLPWREQKRLWIPGSRRTRPTSPGKTWPKPWRPSDQLHPGAESMSQGRRRFWWLPHPTLLHPSGQPANHRYSAKNQSAHFLRPHLGNEACDCDRSAVAEAYNASSSQTHRKLCSDHAQMCKAVIGRKPGSPDDAQIHRSCFRRCRGNRRCGRADQTLSGLHRDWGRGNLHHIDA